MDLNEGKGGATAPAAAQSEPRGTEPALSPQLAAKLACFALILAAPVFALTTWQVDYSFLAIRHFSVPIIVAELIVIFLGLTSGADLRKFVGAFGLAGKLSLATFVFVVLASTVLADAAPGMARPFALSTFIHMLFLGVLCERFSNAWRGMQRNLLASIAAGGAIYFVLAFSLALSVIDKPDFNWKQFSAGVSNVRQIGYYGLATAGIAIGLLANAQKRSETVFAHLLLILGAWCIFWSGGRAAFLGLLATALIVALYKRYSELPRYALNLFANLFSAALLSIIFVPGPLWGLQSIIGRLITNDHGSEYTSGRLTIWWETANWSLQKPILGHGQGQFRFTVEAAGEVLNHPHNSALQILFDWGVLGLVCIAFFAWVIWKKIWIHSPSNPNLALPCIGVLAGLLTMSMLDGALYYAYPITVILCACAVLFTIDSKQTKNV